VRGWIAQFKADVIRTLRRTGLDELQAPDVRRLCDEGFANQLMRLDGSGGDRRRRARRDRPLRPRPVELVILY
jgi:hypothetical protein